MGDINRDIQVDSIIRSLSELPAEERAFREEQAIDLHLDAEGLPPDMDLDTTTAEVVQRWRVAKSLLALREQVNLMAPGRSKASDGTIGDQRHCGPGRGQSDHCPRIRDSDVGVVTAMDITHDPAHGCNSEAIVEVIRNSRDPRVKYLIWNRRIANSSAIGESSPWEWRPYPGANPHNKHCHISVKAEAALYDSAASWAMPSPPVS